MKRLLAIAYFFPPLGGGGCQRTLKLVRYLEPEGWASTVVTTRDADYWILDPSLEAEIPRTAEVIRVGGITSLRLVRLLAEAGGIERRQGARDARAFQRLRRAQSWLLLPDGYRAWAREAQRAAARRIAAGGIDALWTTSSPESAHLAGLALKRRFGIPWVADFRDPWVGRVTYAPPTSWHDARHRELERSVVTAADRVTLVSEPMTALYRERYPDLPGETFVTLPNGVDSDDWRRVAELPASPDSRDEGRCVLLHAGQLAHRPTVRTLLDAVERVISADPSARDQLRLRFLGGNEELRPGEWSERGLDGIVQAEPSRPHLEALQAMRRAYALVLLGHGGDADSLLYTGKIYEYLTSGRPILGVLDPGPAADLILEAGAGTVSRPGDEASTARAIENLLRSFREGQDSAVRPPAALAGGWERKAMAGRAAALLGRLVSPVAG
ncbi:MAG TPA: glycosyltransferase [Candidatus Eisenbacteria bacterium]|nr:glycosyltransferase [Candidatus Eisenbacteria bacterium]